MVSTRPTFRLSRDGFAPLICDKDCVVIGRHADSDLVVGSGMVSRCHAEILRNGDGWVLRDLGSANGTYLNGERVEEHALADGDILGFTDVNIRFEVVSYAPAVDQVERVIIDAENIPTIGSDIGVQEILADPQLGVGWSLNRYNQVARALLSSQDLESVLESVMDLIFESVPARRAVICLRDEETGEYVPRCARSPENSRDDIRISKTIATRAVRDRKATLVADVLDDGRFADNVSIMTAGIRTAICAPLTTETSVLGFVYADSDLAEHRFDQQSLEVVTAVAIMSAAAVEQRQLQEHVARERQVRAKLERYSSPGVVDLIVGGDEAYGSDMIAVEREASVLFADITGFTSMSETMEPLEVSRRLNTIFDRLTRCVFAYDGTLDKFMGDAIMAFFGAPISVEEHARQAILSAIAMQREVAALNAEQGMKHELSIRIGINSGPVIAGDIGSIKRKDYTVIGDTVNVASRLESVVAQPGQIVVGPLTHAQAEADFRYKYLGERELKGKRAGTPCWQVLPGRRLRGTTELVSDSGPS